MQTFNSHDRLFLLSEPVDVLLWDLWNLLGFPPNLRVLVFVSAPQETWPITEDLSICLS